MLAELTRVPAWTVLTTVLANGEELLLTQLATAEADADVLRLARRWQTFRRWTLLVRDEPMRLAEELGVLLETSGSSMELDDLRRARQTDLRPVQFEKVEEIQHEHE